MRTMTIIIVSIIVSLIAVLAIDSVWLHLWAKRFYGDKIGHLMAVNPNFIAAGIFYVIYALGITIFVVIPAYAGYLSNMSTFLLGALYGLVAYLMYNLTNHTKFKEWPVLLTIVDSVWGAFLGGTVSLLALLALGYFA